MKRYFQRTAKFIKKHRICFSLLTAFFTLGLVILATILFTIHSNKKFVLSPDTDKHIPVGIVLGAGITKDGKPFRELQSRLDVAADSLHKGTVDKLILSGDNRFANYSEPDAMIRYLAEEKGISKDLLQPDYAGRSTYESCERASKIFGLKKAIIFSAGSHLPRAIYLCRHFGIETYGIPSKLEANNSTRREVLASVKAMLNVHVRGEPTILGEPIQMQD